MGCPSRPFPASGCGATTGACRRRDGSSACDVALARSARQRRLPAVCQRNALSTGGAPAVPTLREAYRASVRLQ